MAKRKPPSKGAVAAGRMASQYRVDGFTNHVTGYGTARDKTTYGHYVAPAILRDAQLSNIYHSHDLAARIVDVVPAEALREPWELDLGDADASSEVDEVLERLRTRERFAQGWRDGRCYGGAATVIGADDGRPAAMPLDASRARDIDFLYTVDKRFLTPLRYYEDPASGKMGEPETYMMGAPGRAVRMVGEIHESRLILWPGATTSTTEKQANAGWDFSVLQRPYEVIRSFDEAFHRVRLL